MSARSSKPSIPAWQQEAPSSTSASADTPATETTTDNEHKPTTTSKPPASADRSDLLEQAKTFLADPEIRDATTSRKIAFLESKGLTNAEIEALLGVSRNEDITQTNVESKPPGTQEKVTVENDNAVATAIAVPSTTAATTATDSKTTPSPPRDVPPIITYPEFLTKASAQNKPPLLSLRSVIYTLYGAAGIGATFYGASELLVKPMLKSLGDARHELFNTAIDNLSGLNEKLEGVVSRVPPRGLSSDADADADARSAALAEDKEEDVESISSDPTEVFHRDIATQTTSDLLNDDNNTTATTRSSDDTIDDKLLKTVDSHKEKLTAIRSLLQELVSEHTDSGNLNDTMRNSVSDLQSYLDGLKYSTYNSYLNNNNNFYNTNTYTYSTVGSNTSSGGGGGGGGGGSSQRSKEEDAISAFRAEIRGVKGALLSARNFPSGRPAGIAR